MTIWMRIVISLFFLTICTCAIAQTSSPIGLHTAQIEKIINIKGTLNKQAKYFKISMPRDDLDIHINGAIITPAMGLTSSVVFKNNDDIIQVTGDLVLTEDQINPVIDTVLNNNLRVTMLHSHFLWESPRVMYLHIEGEGSERALATAIKNIFAEIKSTNDGNGSFPIANIDPAESQLNTQTISKILGLKGILKDGTYKIDIHQSEISDENSWAAFTGSDQQAVVYGNVNVSADNFKQVFKAFNKVDINVMSIHQNTTAEDDEPTFSIYYWGVGNTATLAKGLRIALLIHKKPSYKFTGALEACPRYILRVGQFII